MIDLTYRDLDSPLHRLGIHTKIVLFGLLCILSLVYSDLLFLISIAVTCLVLAWGARVGGRATGFIKYFLVFSFIVFSVNLVANQNGENTIFRTTIRFYLWRIPFQLTLESLSSSLRMVLRLFAVVLAFLVFTLTTKPDGMLNRISRLSGFEGFGMLLALSYRFLPTLVSDGALMRDSLSSRGVRFDEGSRLARAKSYASLGVPLIVSSLDRSLQLAEAMESRGYGGDGARKTVPGGRSIGEVLLTSYYLAAGCLFLGLWLLAGIGRASLFGELSLAPVAPALLGVFVAPIFLEARRR